MFITALLCAKPKSKFVLVACRSQVSGHTINLIRERLGDKFEFMQFDPFENSSYIFSPDDGVLQRTQKSAESKKLERTEHVHKWLQQSNGGRGVSKNAVNK
ncbi:uncharacterized protein mRpL33 isoform X1 [Fopius arisanus]|uniref:Uncharacterized protein mRpL33 isoform X1 n=1 Tax=Fopius arisanus TaxID=64838 RepID=A0A9R1TQ87_9HYME|nr:PREDICTED: uncharacterized protein LOC105273174 isoform X1 [Fopius arisanus]